MIGYRCSLLTGISTGFAAVVLHPSSMTSTTVTLLSPSSTVGVLVLAAATTTTTAEIFACFAAVVVHPTGMFSTLASLGPLFASCVLIVTATTASGAASSSATTTTTATSFSVQSLDSSDVVGVKSHVRCVFPVVRIHNGVTVLLVVFKTQNVSHFVSSNPHQVDTSSASDGPSFTFIEMNSSDWWEICVCKNFTRAVERISASTTAVPMCVRSESNIDISTISFCESQRCDVRPQFQSGSNCRTNIISGKIWGVVIVIVRQCLLSPWSVVVCNT